MLRRAVWLLFSAFAVLAAFTLTRTLSFVGQPFPGFLMYPNCMVSLFGSDDWSGVRAGIEAWDVIREVDGRPVSSAGEVLEIVRRVPPGTTFVYTVGRNGETVNVPAPSMRFDELDFASESLPFLVTGVVFAVAGLGIYLARPGRANFGFAVFGLAIGAALLRVDFFVKSTGAYPLQFMLPLVAAALVHLGLVFPRRPAAVGVAVRWVTGSRAAISFLPLIAAWLWIGSLAYAAVKRNIFDFEIFARRTVTYSILWVLSVAGYAAALIVSQSLLARLGYS